MSVALSSIKPVDLPPATSPGRRARNKADKLERITAAARALFVERGFDATTLRDVAAAAGVGFGTIFDYAANKRDLLFLIFNPALEHVLDEAIGTGCAVPTQPFLDAVMGLFGGYYRLYAADRQIARAVLRELTFFSEGGEARKFIAHRARFLGSVVAMARDAVAAGDLIVADPALLAELIFALFAWEVRRWLAGERPDPEHGLAALRRLLVLQLSGFVRRG